VARTDAVVIAPRPLAAAYAATFHLKLIPPFTPIAALEIAMVRREASTPDPS
jgi:hypothetical protein